MFRRIMFILLASITMLPIGNAKYLLGEPNKKWGVDLTKNLDTPLKMRLGTRLQTVFTAGVNENHALGNNTGYQDFYLRRVRFQVEANYKEGIKYYMDLRNDNVNKEDKGERTFNVGDAYIQLNNIFGVKNLYFKAFRAKINLSRSETISSSKVLFLDRPQIADGASHYISDHRRATNAQIVGNFDKVYFQAALGDGVQGKTFYDAQGNHLDNGNIKDQNLMFGGKLRIAPFTGWEDKKPTGSYLGKGKHFSFGAAYWQTAGIEYANSKGGSDSRVSRSLINGELSFHYKNLTFQAEYFHFNGVIENFEDQTNQNEGSANGYYAQAEYVIPTLSYLAPFVRYEQWDRFKEKDDYNVDTLIAGINWYLKGRNISIGLVYQHDKTGSSIDTIDKFGRDFDENKQVKLTSMWYY